MKKSNKALPFIEAGLVLAAEIVISAIVCAVFLLLDKFSYKVVTGAALGSLITVFNYLFLSITTGNAIDKMLAARGEGEMDEEEAAKFAKEYEATFTNAAKLSYAVRNFTMLATLIAAFLIGYFNVFATLVPLLAFRPIITLLSLLESKLQKKEKKG